VDKPLDLFSLFPVAHDAVGLKLSGTDDSPTVLMTSCNRFGRKKTVLCFFGVKITGILMSWFGSSYVVFVIGRLLVGAGQVGFFMSGFVLGLGTVFLFTLALLMDTDCSIIRLH